MIFDTLTKREKEVLDYLICGFSNEEIARLLFFSEGWINAIVMRLYEKYQIDYKPHRVKLVLKRLKEMGKI